jgi:3-oxoacyl-[acyl-carrier protein] reductase
VGRVAIVTGAAGGFGTAIAERLREDGFEVLGGDLPELDVTDDASVAVFVTRAVERHGRVDVLVNNAGVAGPTAPVEEYPVDEWRRVLDVNLTGTFLCTRRCIPPMRERGLSAHSRPFLAPEPSFPRAALRRPDGP